MTIGPLGKPSFWVRGLILGYGLFLALITGLNGLGPDRWWLGAFNLYLPQVLWLVPVILLTPFALRFARRWTWMLVVYGLWVCGPIMGFHWAFRPQQAAVEGGGTLRVMTCNIKYGRRDLAPLIGDLLRHRPDVVFLQDVEYTMKGPLGAFFRDWQVRSYGQYVIASRWPLGRLEACSPTIPMEHEFAVRTRLQFGATSVALYNVHLLTPREGLNAMRVVRKDPGRLDESIQDLQENVERRVLQAARVADRVRQERGATILAGDLNSPDGALAYRALKEAKLHNAFNQGGRGYGFTYGHFLLRGRLPWLPMTSWMRIDHILLSPGLRSDRSWTGNGEASDHRPVYADIFVPAP